MNKNNKIFFDRTKNVFFEQTLFGDVVIRKKTILNFYDELNILFKNNNSELTELVELLINCDMIEPLYFAKMYDRTSKDSINIILGKFANYKVNILIAANAAILKTKKDKLRIMNDLVRQCNMNIICINGR